MMIFWQWVTRYLRMGSEYAAASDNDPYGDHSGPDSDDPDRNSSPKRPIMVSFVCPHTLCPNQLSYHCERDNCEHHPDHDPHHYNPHHHPHRRWADRPVRIHYPRHFDLPRHHDNED